MILIGPNIPFMYGGNAITSNSYSNYYQWLFRAKTTDIVEDGTHFAENYGTGGEALRASAFDATIGTEGLQDDGSTYLMPDNAALNSVLDRYGLPLKNSDGVFDYNKVANINGYPFQSNIKQLFLNQNKSILAGDELYDSSDNGVNADVYETCYDSSLQTEVVKTLAKPIDFDWATNGVKFEFITTLKDISTDSTLVMGEGTDRTYIRASNGTPYIYMKKSTSPFYTIVNFFPASVPADDSLHRVKFETVNNVLTCYITTVDDEDYSNAQSKSRDLATYTDLITTSKVVSIGGLNGRLFYCNLLSQEFYFNVGNRTNIVPSINSDNYVKNVEGRLSWQNDFLVLKDGYTALYFNAENTIFFIQLAFVPKINGNSVGQWLVYNTTVYQHKHEYETAYHTIHFEDFDNGYFYGYGIKLDASIEPYDIDNTYFNVSSDAKLVTSNIQPERLDDKIFFNRDGNKDLLIYDTATDLVNTTKLVEENIVCFGDSTVGGYWVDMLAHKIIMNVTKLVYGGQTTENILNSIQAAVVGDVTLISRQKVISHISGFNDYTQAVSPATYANNLQLTIDFLRRENPNAPIILNCVYDWWPTINPTGNPDVPNTNGLTFNIIRQIVIDAVNTNDNCYLCNWNNAGIIESDTDGVHTYSNSGGLKLLNQFIPVLTNLTEGNIQNPIPKYDFAFDLDTENKVITNIRVADKDSIYNPIVDALDFNDENNSQYITVI